MKFKIFFHILALLVGLQFVTVNASALPENFQDTVIWNNLFYPTAISFSPDGKIFIAEKSGIIKVFDNLQDTTPTIFADLRSQVHEYSDRGLLGLAVDPQFPVKPYVYVLYTVDAPLGSNPPYYNDNCPNPDYCPAGARLSKLTASGSTMVAETVLIENWCQIDDSHSVGTLFFGLDGALYVSHGDGASYNYVDFGQDGGCSDPVNEGGALRSQDLRTSGDPVTYNGSILRIDAETGAAFPGNPLAGGANTEDDRIISYGFRNPYRFSIDPSTGAIWVADVGWNEWEEVNHIASPFSSVGNYGWPCYEGIPRQSGYDAANIPICEALYTSGVAKAPYYSYAHNGSSRAVSAIGLYRGTNLPAAYNGALFFGDYTQGWIRVMMPGANGLPNVSNIVDFIPSGAFPVDIKVGPNGALYYVDIVMGTVHQISYYTLNTPPTAALSASTDSGALPLVVDFDGSGSFDPDTGDTFQYAWDLDGDGTFDDSTAVNPSFTYTQAQTVTVKLRVTDFQGASHIASTTIYAGNRPPVVTITDPTVSTLYNVGETISFSGNANDPDVGFLSPSALSWETVLYHCALNDPNECHDHAIQSFNGVYSGFITAPDHEYPSRIEFRLTAADPAAPALKRTASVIIEPRTSTWTFTSNPSGLQLVAYGAAAATPFTRTVIVNAQSTISAPTPQQIGTAGFEFASWSDAGAQTHTVTASSTPQTFHANYTAAPASSVWHSWEMTTQAGSPQGVVISNTNLSAQVEFYESTDDLGILKQALFNVFAAEAHEDAFNNVAGFWSDGTGASAYPYAGKSTVSRGADTGEDNAPGPLGVFDLQLFPPNNAHTAVAAFKVPQDGTYTLTDIGLRRVSASGDTVRLRIFSPQGAELAALTAANDQDWVTSSNILPIAGAVAGEYIYFAVDGDGANDSDAAEIAWTISASFDAPAPQPTCALNTDPASIQEGGTTSVSWTTTDATAFSIDQGIGGQASVGSGSVTRSPVTTTTYTGTATGPGGSGQCSATVTVTPAGPQPTCALSMNPTTILQGASATLSWTSQNAVAGSIDPGIGALTAAIGSLAGTPSVTTTYLGTAIGPTGSQINCSTTLTVTPLPPTCSLAANPTSITSGNTSSLSWTTSNTTSISIDQGIGTVTPVTSGSRSVSPTATTTYTATVTGPGGSSTCARTITVTQPLPTCTLSANPTTIASGSSSSLSWISSNATSISINQGIGTVTPVASGSRSVSPTVTTTYTATVTGPGGTNTCSRTVTVTQTLPTCTLSATPTSITSGGSSSLAWTSQNATGISINQGIGAVTPVAGGSRSVSPTATTTYTATVTGPGGTNTCTRTITVTQPLPTCTLTPNPASITSGGSSSLAWTSQNATSISINQGIGTVTPVASGSRSVSPAATTAYTATVTGPGGTNTCSGTVTVIQPLPTCTLSLSPQSITRGSSSTLSWTSQNGISGSISPGFGAITSASGSASVSPTSTTTYTGTVNGTGATSSTCSATLTVFP